MHLPHRDAHYWRNLTLFVLIVLGAVAVGAVIFSAHRLAQAYVTPVRYQADPADTPAQFGVAYQNLTLTTTDGITLSAWYTPPTNGAVILVAHGYAGARSGADHARFARWGYGVISWDARAHGVSGGDISTMGYFEKLDAEAALNFARQQPGVRRVGAFGQSMGAATLIRAAAHHPEIAAIVVDSAYPNLDEMVKAIVPWPVINPLLRFFAAQATGITPDQMRPVVEIARLSPRPVLIIQGTADTTIPPDSAARLYAAAGGPRTLWLVPGAGHVASHEVDPIAYDQKLAGFFAAYLLAP